MAYSKEVRQLRDEIMQRLYWGIHHACERGVELYQAAVSVPVVFHYTPRGRRAERSLPGEYPRRETGQGQENIASETLFVRNGVVGGFGVRGPEWGTGPYKRQSDLPGHFVPGGHHLAALAGAPELGGAPGYTGSERRKGPQDIFLEHLGDLREAFKAGVRKPDVGVPF